MLIGKKLIINFNFCKSLFKGLLIYWILKYNWEIIEEII